MYEIHANSKLNQFKLDLPDERESRDCPGILRLNPVIRPYCPGFQKPSSFVTKYPWLVSPWVRAFLKYKRKRRKKKKNIFFWLQYTFCLMFLSLSIFFGFTSRNRFKQRKQNRQPQRRQRLLQSQERQNSTSKLPSKVTWSGNWNPPKLRRLRSTKL